MKGEYVTEAVVPAELKYRWPDVLAAWERNETLQQIGDRFGYTREWVRCVLKAHGVTGSMSRARRTRLSQLDRMAPWAQACRPHFDRLELDYARWTGARTCRAWFRVAGLTVPVIVHQPARPVRTVPGDTPWYYRFSRVSGAGARIVSLAEGPAIAFGLYDRDLYVRDLISSPRRAVYRHDNTTRWLLLANCTDAAMCLDALRQSAYGKG